MDVSHRHRRLHPAFLLPVVTPPWVYALQALREHFEVKQNVI